MLPMLEIARRAGASNETLYKWYGNKQGLFKSLVEDNATRITSMIYAVINDVGDDRGLDVLIPVGERRLSVLASERAIALNRAAACDVQIQARLEGPFRRTVAKRYCRPSRTSSSKQP